jgi:hypothetical protein
MFLIIIINFILQLIFENLKKVIKLSIKFIIKLNLEKKNLFDLTTLPKRAERFQSMQSNVP